MIPSQDLIMSKKKGDWAEAEVIKYLRKEGKKILEQEWRVFHLEIDIIYMDGPILVFSEVKYRENDYFGSPQDFVTLKKQKLIIRAANEYIDKYSMDCESRFDVFALCKNSFEHFKDAFRPY